MTADTGSSLQAQLDLTRLPKHVAIIMDGNGRWAKQHFRPRIFGHRAGIKSVRDVVTACAEVGVEWLTLYAFSVENWKRPANEVSALMRLLNKFMHDEIPEMQENGIRFRVIGRTQDLPKAVQDGIAKATAETAAGRRTTLTLALSYGGRAEIVDAARKLASSVAAGEIGLEEIDERSFSSALYTAEYPDPDLLIRTSGELRVSNFLLWQIAYTEMWITPVLWPDFRREQLYAAILDYQHRQRRFGGVS